MTIRSGRERLEAWALVPLRVMLGLGFALHGIAKLDRGPERFVEVLRALAIPLPAVTGWGTILLELAGGLALTLGVAVIPVSIPLAVVMLTALLKVHLPLGFSGVRLLAVTARGPQFGPVGYEMNLLYLVGLLSLALGGETPASLDRWVTARRRRAQPSQEVETSTTRYPSGSSNVAPQRSQ